MKRFLLALSLVVLAAAQPASGRTRFRGRRIASEGRLPAVISGLRTTPATDIHYRMPCSAQRVVSGGRAGGLRRSEGKLLLNFNEKNVEAVLAVDRALVAQKNSRKPTR